MPEFHRQISLRRIHTDVLPVGSHNIGSETKPFNRVVAKSLEASDGTATRFKIDVDPSTATIDLRSPYGYKFAFHADVHVPELAVGNMSIKQIGNITYLQSHQGLISAIDDSGMRLLYNLYYDGSSWQRLDTTKSGLELLIGTGDQYLRFLSFDGTSWIPFLDINSDKTLITYGNIQPATDGSLLLGSDSYRWKHVCVRNGLRAYTQGFIPRSTANDNVKVLHAAGPTSDFIISLQDGTGRVQFYWNSTPYPSTYIVANEPAGKISFNPQDFNNVFVISWAPASSTAGTSISWITLLSLTQSGGLRVRGSTSIGAIANPSATLHVYTSINNGILVDSSGDHPRLMLQGTDANGVKHKLVLQGGYYGQDLEILYPIAGGYLMIASSLAASSTTTTINPAALVFRGRYYDGSASQNYNFTIKPVVIDTTPSAALEFYLGSSLILKLHSADGIIAYKDILPNSDGVISLGSQLLRLKDGFFSGTVTASYFKGIIDWSNVINKKIVAQNAGTSTDVTITATSESLIQEYAVQPGYIEGIHLVASNPSGSNCSLYLQLRAHLEDGSEVNLCDWISVGEGSGFDDWLRWIYEKVTDGLEITSIRLYAYVSGTPNTGYEPSARIDRVTGVRIG